MVSNANAVYKLPWWYRPYIILPLACILLVVFGFVFNLPPNLIDPRKYPAFMDGGSDWGGSNVFFHSRVIMLLMGILGFLSLGYLKPYPNWKEIPSKSRLLLFLFKSHLLCFFLYFTGTPNHVYKHAFFESTAVVLWLEMLFWYISSAYFGVQLLMAGVSLSHYLVSAIVSLMLLVVGFYCGFWLTGAEFQADAIPLRTLLMRLVIQMAVYIAGMVVWALLSLSICLFIKRRRKRELIE